MLLPLPGTEPRNTSECVRMVSFHASSAPHTFQLSLPAPSDTNTNHLMFLLPKVFPMLHVACKCLSAQEVFTDTDTIPSPHWQCYF